MRPVEPRELPEILPGADLRILAVAEAGAGEGGESVQPLKILLGHKLHVVVFGEVHGVHQLRDGLREGRSVHVLVLEETLVGPMQLGCGVQGVKHQVRHGQQLRQT